MATAKKLPSGSWRCRVYDYTDDDGKAYYRSFTSSDPSKTGKREAEYMAAEFAANKKIHLSTSTKTFGGALDDYINKRISVLSPGTIREYKRKRKFGYYDIMDKQISDITQEYIQVLINKDALDHSPKTVRNNHGLISSVMKQECPHFALSTILPKKVRPNLYVPSDDDVSRLVQCVKGTDMELPILLGAFGPMRRAEICALDSDHIKGNVVYVEFNMVLNEFREWVIKSPKTYAGNRFIDYPGFVADRWKGIEGRITKLNPDSITRKFSKILDNSGIKHFRFHDLRHYSASIQHALGVPDAYIMARAGWSSDAVLKNVYRHTMDDETAKMNLVTNDHFASLYDTKYDTK